MKVKKLSAVVFQAWWNDRGFYSEHPLYLPFRKLHGFGADLDYVEFLCSLMLRFDDFFLIQAGKPTVDRQAKSRKAYLNRHGGELAVLLAHFGRNLIEFTCERIAELYLRDNDPKQLLSIADCKAIQGRALERMTNRMMDDFETQRQKIVARRRSLIERLQAEAQTSPLMKLLLQYSPREYPKRGNQADPWGTFFLLALTEHLREMSGGHPHHEEAMALLKKVRGLYGKGSRHKVARSSVAERVRKFKAHYPDWQQDLKILLQQSRQPANRPLFNQIDEPV